MISLLCFIPFRQKFINSVYNFIIHTCDNGPMLSNTSVTQQHSNYIRMNYKIFLFFTHKRFINRQCISVFFTITFFTYTVPIIFNSHFFSRNGRPNRLVLIPILILIPHFPLMIFANLNFSTIS